MKEWYDYHFGFTEWKQFRYKLFFLFKAAVVFILIVKGYWFIQSLRYDGKARALIFRVEPVERIEHSMRQGSPTVIVYYRCRYAYSVKGIRYNGTAVKMAGWSRPEKGAASVWYDADKPWQSLLVIN
jgi:hypothetical protein